MEQILISVALNIQKYAHNQLQPGTGTTGTDPMIVMTPSPHHTEDPFDAHHDTQGLHSVVTSTAPSYQHHQQRHRQDTDHASVHSYQSSQSSGSSVHSDHSNHDSDTSEQSDTLATAPQRPGQDDCKSTDSGSDTAYLQSKAWWTGMTLMILGECGNFMAYGYAQASIIAPLGTVALISNVILAPLMLREPFRRRDLLGIVIAIIGTVVVVVNSKENEIKLTPETMAAALLQTQFLIYLFISCVALGVLISLSDTIGSEYIFIDLSVVAIFGGYTVLATKGVSSLLSLSFYKMFTYPISYLLVFVLVSTAVLQIRFLNKSLQRFDSTQVIPTQFVLFTASAIIGSGILYNDFDEMDFNKGLHFLTGCCMTFLGVYFITSHRDKDEPDSPIINPDWTVASQQHYTPIPQRSSFDLYPPNRVLYQAEYSRSDLLLEQGRAQPRDMSYGIPPHPNRPPRSTATGDSFGHNASIPLLGTSAKHATPVPREAGFSLTSSMHNVLAAVGSRHTSLLGLEKVMENYTAHKNEERRGSIHSLNQTAPLQPPRPGLGSRSSSACSGVFPPPSITTYPSSTSLLTSEPNYGSSYQTHIPQPQPSPLHFSRPAQPGGVGSIDPRFHAPHLQERSHSQDGNYKQPRRKISTPMLRGENREVPPLPPKIKTSTGVAVPGPHGRRGDRHAFPSPSEHEFMTSVARSIDSVSSSTPRASSKFPAAGGGILTASPTKLHHPSEGSAYSFRTLKSPTGSTHPPLSSFEQEGWASSLPPLHPSSLTEVSQQHQPHNAQRPKKKTTGSGGSGNGSTAAQEGDSTKMTSPQGRRKGSVPKGDDSCLQQQ
ncbi:hypothetical protein BGZ97_005810 [Linnemannia gamsii]|uniref:DUF803-domain-containing protein n=1 Tax=Linnemannia gamsii TaxID=64522 RepID=A0A9P6RL16_9FUNG|nr:hypothetical protein BGZ97_005810 [Linnemannia gamsii]